MYMIEKIVISLSKHPMWGYVIQPLLVSENEYGMNTILEFADSHTAQYGDLNEAGKQLILLAESISDAQLMRLYSKEKNIAAFHKKVKPEIVEKSIKPYIETKQEAMIQLIEASDMPIYLREKVTVRHLYASDQILIPTKTPTVYCHFAKPEEESYIRYTLQITWDEEAIELIHQTPIILSHSPAIFILDHKLFHLPGVEMKRFTPFFSKNQIEVPLSYERTYLNTFVRNCLEQHVVSTDGMNVQRIEAEKQAHLEIDLDEEKRPMLRLSLRYNGNEICDGPGTDKIIECYDTETGPALQWFERDAEWEKNAIGRLLRSGMEKIDERTFIHKKVRNEKLVSKQVKLMKEWIKIHEEMLQDYQFNVETL